MQNAIPMVTSNGCLLHVAVDGPEDGPVLMLGNSLGTDVRVWDAMLPHLPQGLRVVRFDKRGHGLSDCPEGPYTVEMLAEDALAVADAYRLRDVVFVGLSIGGLIGQAVALKRPDLLRGLVLMDTCQKIGTAEMWADRIEALRTGGIESLADAIMERWFAPGFRSDPVQVTPWRHMVVRTPVAGYIACCEAIAAADFSGARLDLPVLAMAGDHDLSTPPDQVAETARAYGGRFHLIDAAGHIPCVEQPGVTAGLITDFLKEINHV